MSKSDFLISVFVLLFVGMLLLVFPCHYLTNDDIHILFDILGGFDVSFMSILLGKVLSFFYLNIHNDIPWYSLFFYLLHVLSVFLFIKSVLKIERFKYLCFPFLMVYLLLYSNFIIAISFTVTAIMIGANSLFAFLVYLQAPKKSFFVVALLGGAFSFSHLVREKAFLGIVVFSLPILFFILFSRIRDYKYWIVFFIPVLLVFGTNSLVKIYGVTQQYKDFVEFNKIRAEFHDRPEKREYKKILEVNGWTENDYEMMSQWWFCSDERKFNTDTLKNFLTYSVPMSDSVQKPMSDSVQKPMSDSVQKPMSDSVQKPMSAFSFSSLLSFVKKTFKRRSGYGYFGLFGCIWILSFTLLTLKDLLLLNVYSLYCVGILGYIAKFYRLPFRVGAPVFLMITGLLVYLIFARGNQNSRKFSRIAQFIFIIVLFILFTLEALNFYNYIEKKVKIEGVAFNNDISKLNTEYADAIFFPQIARGSFKIEYLSPLKPIKFQFHLISPGWPTYSPRFYQNIENALGIRHGYELLLKMVDNDKAFFITRDEKFNSCLITYMKETFNLNVTFIKVDELSNSNIYKAISR